MKKIEIATLALQKAVVEETAGAIEAFDNGILQDSDSNVGWDASVVARKILEAVGVDPDSAA